jgi:hypothetical protein
MADHWSSNYPLEPHLWTREKQILVLDETGELSSPKTGASDRATCWLSLLTLFQNETALSLVVLNHSTSHKHADSGISLIRVVALS